MKAGTIQQLDDPVTIYNKPKNLYVAGFMGSPTMNFIKAEAESANSLKMEAGSIDVSDYKAGAGMSAGQKIIFGARPEHIRLNSADEKGFSKAYDGIIEIVEPMGSDSLVWIKFGGQLISARIESSAHYAPEEKVKVRFRVGLASLFDEASGDRI
jgi:multiple sugar transport system ATP-binding protein